jgi:predicted nuclease of restriction endonuclease-like RecB superfamily
MGISLEACYRGMYADLDANQRLVRFADRVHETAAASDETNGTSTTRLTGQHAERYRNDTLIVDWLLDRYNLALAQAVLYDASELQIRIWDQFGTVFSYVKLFGLIHRIYPIAADGERVSDTNQAAGYEAILDGPVSLFSQSRKYGIWMAMFLSALPLCDRWQMAADILVDETASETRQFTLDETAPLDLERTLARKWDRANTDRALHRQQDVLDLGAEVMLPDFAVEHPDGRRALFEIVGFWTPDYLDKKLVKIRAADADNLVLAVSEQLDCASENFGVAAERVIWFKTGIYVYNVVDLVEEYASAAA